jgi:hypothetical protein
VDTIRGGCRVTKSGFLGIDAAGTDIDTGTVAESVDIWASTGSATNIYAQDLGAKKNAHVTHGRAVAFLNCLLLALYDLSWYDISNSRIRWQRSRTTRFDLHTSRTSLTDKYCQTHIPRRFV